MGELNKMETKPMLPLIVTMSVPPLISMFLQYTYNFVDCMFVSWISEDALTAVSLAFPITTLMIAMSIGTGVGVNVLIARYLGQKNQDMANSVVSNGIILSAACGVIVTIVVLLIMKPFFASFTEDSAIYDMAVDYMRICAFMEVSSMVHICIQKVLQGTGNMIAPMWFQIAGVLLNFVLDPLLIFGVWIFPEMGVEGAAVSTVCGYTFSMILAFYVLIFRKQKVKIKTKGFKLDFKIFKEIFVIGFPSIFDECARCIHDLFHQSVPRALFYDCRCIFRGVFQAAAGGDHDAQRSGAGMHSDHELQLWCEERKTFDPGISVRKYDRHPADWCEHHHIMSLPVAGSYCVQCIGRDVVVWCACTADHVHKLCICCDRNDGRFIYAVDEEGKVQSSDQYTETIRTVDTGYVAVVKIYGHDRDLVRIYSRRGHHSCNQLGFI